jgi:hypothetical protein
MRKSELVLEPGNGFSKRRQLIPIGELMSPLAVQTMPG